MSLLAPSLGRSIAPPRWLPLALVGGAALVMLSIVQTNPDVSWGLTMAEKWLDGGRLYVDIVEVNPPATLFLYVVPVWLARHIGLTPELMTDALVLSAAASSIFIAARVLGSARCWQVEQGRWLLAMTAAALVVLPGESFGEREHIAVIAVLPLLAVNWLRTTRTMPSLHWAIIAGLGAGIAAIIKPYFAAAILCSGAAAAWSARSWRTLFALENWIAAALLAAYVVFVWLAYPLYFTDMLPLLAAVYIPMKEPLAEFLQHFVTPLWVLMLLMTRAFGRADMLKPPTVLLVAASVGFAFSYFLQQKGWPNHSYPMLALALLALGYVLVTRRAGWRGRVLGGAAGLVVAGLTFSWMTHAKDHAALVAPIRSIAPHPKILAISSDLTVGHPITRAVGGAWVSHVSSLWITQGVLIARAGGGLDPATAARLDAYAARDREMLTDDIANNRPDIILVERSVDYDWLAWARSDPMLAAQMASYRPYRTVGNVLIMRRSPGS